uniref:Uncharacterized protein n=1 Tax=Magallana gigas TaxID=29159 RepID=A0A8W8KTT1_MAGGI
MPWAINPEPQHIVTPGPPQIAYTDTVIMLQNTFKVFGGIKRMIMSFFSYSRWKSCWVENKETNLKRQVLGLGSCSVKKGLDLVCRKLENRCIVVFFLCPHEEFDTLAICWCKRSGPCLAQPCEFGSNHTRETVDIAEAAISFSSYWYVFLFDASKRI